METRQLGSAGLIVPTVGLGAGRTFDVRGARAEVNASAALDQALSTGARQQENGSMR